MREPVVAGQFYPGNRKNLEKDLEEMIPGFNDRTEATGIVSPHAGYMYSGAVAGEVYGRIKPRSSYVILSPNHTGYGARFSMSAEAWRTPLGVSEIDKELSEAIKQKTSLVEEDAQAHAFEHSIEVQLPFIQRTSGGAKIVPITVMQGSITELAEVADAIASSISETKREVTIVASSDMTHFESRASAKKKDEHAIKKVLDLDPEGLIQVVGEEDISMCGYIPAAIMLMAAKKLNAKKAELIKYADSGDATGDTAQVVGYAGIVVY